MPAHRKKKNHRKIEKAEENAYRKKKILHWMSRARGDYNSKQVREGRQM